MIMKFELKDIETTKKPGMIIENAGLDKIKVSIENNDITIDKKELQVVLDAIDLKKKLYTENKAI